MINNIFFCCMILIHFGIFCSNQPEQKQKIIFQKGGVEIQDIEVNQGDDFTKTDLFKFLEKNHKKILEEQDQYDNDLQVKTDKNTINIDQENPENLIHIFCDKTEFVQAYNAYKKPINSWEIDDFIAMYNVFDSVTGELEKMIEQTEPFLGYNRDQENMSPQERMNETVYHFPLIHSLFLQEIGWFIDKDIITQENLFLFLNPIVAKINSEVIKSHINDYIKFCIIEKFPNFFMTQFFNLCTSVEFPPNFENEISIENTKSIQCIGNWTLLTSNKIASSVEVGFGAEQLLKKDLIVLYNNNTKQILKSFNYRMSTNGKFMWLEDLHKNPYVIDFNQDKSLEKAVKHSCQMGRLEDMFDQNNYCTFFENKISFMEGLSLIKAFYVICDQHNQFVFQRNRLKYMFVDVDENYGGILIFNYPIQLIYFLKNLEINQIHGLTKKIVKRTKFEEFFLNKFGIEDIEILNYAVIIQSRHSGNKYNFSITDKINGSCFEEIYLSSDHANYDYDSNLEVDGGPVKKTYHSLSKYITLEFIPSFWCLIGGPVGPCLKLQYKNKSVTLQFAKSAIDHTGTIDSSKFTLHSLESYNDGNNVLYTLKICNNIYMLLANELMKSLETINFVESKNNAILRAEEFSVTSSSYTQSVKNNKDYDKVDDDSDSNTEEFNETPRSQWKKYIKPVVFSSVFITGLGLILFVFKNQIKNQYEKLKQCI